MVRTCEKHGDYTTEEIKVFGITIVPGCPKCGDEQEALERQQEEQDRRRKKEQSLLARGIEREYWNKTLDDYRPENDSERAALEAAKDLKDGNIKKLLLLGGNGVGKTLLASILAQQEDGVIITMFELSARIRQGYNNGMSELEILDGLLDHSLIVIDELGRTKGSETEHNWLSYVIGKAHSRDIKLLLISNRHTARQLPKERQGEAIENYFDNDVISRLRQSSRIVEVIGRDRRAAIPAV